MILANSVVRPALVQLARLAARSDTAVASAVIVRDICRSVLKYRFMNGIDPVLNGELKLVTEVARHVKNYVDVGANAGDWTDTFHRLAPKDAQGLLVDASAGVCSHLLKRFAGHDGIRVANMALSDTPGELLFYEEPELGETSSLVRGFSTPEAVGRTVRVSTLDLEVAALGWERVDFLKVDAEGYDLHVIRGAAGLLQQQKVGILQFEYNKPWMLAGSTLNGAYSLLRGCGYAIYLIRPDGLYTLDPAYIGEWFSYANFAAVSRDYHRHIEHLLKGAA